MRPYQQRLAVSQCSVALRAMLPLAEPQARKTRHEYKQSSSLLAESRRDLRLGCRWRQCWLSVSHVHWQRPATVGTKTQSTLGHPQSTSSSNGPSSLSSSSSRLLARRTQDRAQSDESVTIDDLRAYRGMRLEFQPSREQNLNDTHSSRQDTRSTKRQ